MLEILARTTVFARKKECRKVTCHVRPGLALSQFATIFVLIQCLLRFKQCNYSKLWTNSKYGSFLVHNKLLA